MYVLMQHPVNDRLPSALDRRIMTVMSDRQCKRSQDHIYSTGIDGKVEIMSTVDTRYFPKSERVTVLKPSTSTSNGRYTVIGGCQKYMVIRYDYLPDHIYRRDRITIRDTLILRKHEGNWYPCEILTDSELSSMRSFSGAIGLDVDKALASMKTADFQSLIAEDEELVKSALALKESSLKNRHLAKKVDTCLRRVGSKKR